jgi:hypothetical protein
MLTNNPSLRNLLALCAFFALCAVSSSLACCYLYQHIQGLNARIAELHLRTDQQEKAMREEQGPRREGEGAGIHLIPIEDSPRGALEGTWERRKREE